MPGELIHYLNGVAAPARGQRMSRRSTALARHVVEEVRVSGLQADGTLALAGHLMEGLVDLDEHRKQLAQDDVALNMLLSDIEATAVRQCKRIQAGLFHNQCFGL